MPMAIMSSWWEAGMLTKVALFTLYIGPYCQIPGGTPQSSSRELSLLLPAHQETVAPPTLPLQNLHTAHYIPVSTDNTQPVKSPTTSPANGQDPKDLYPKDVHQNHLRSF